MPKKQIAQASLLRDMLLISVMYLAPQLTSNGVGSGVLTQKFIVNSAFNMNSLDLQCFVFVEEIFQYHQCNLPMQTNRELLQHGP